MTEREVISRTTNQINADKVDLAIFNAMWRAREHAGDAHVDDVNRERWLTVVRGLNDMRLLLRRMMHPEDRSATTGIG